MKSDKDEDFIIDPEEVNRLILRLRGIPGVEFDEAKLRKALERDSDIGNFADKYLSSKRGANDGIFKY